VSFIIIFRTFSSPIANVHAVVASTGRFYINQARILPAVKQHCVAVVKEISSQTMEVAITDSTGLHAMRSTENSLENWKTTSQYFYRPRTLLFSYQSCPSPLCSFPAHLWPWFLCACHGQLTRQIYSGLMQWTNGAYKESCTVAGTTLSKMPTSITFPYQPATTFVHH